MPDRLEINGKGHTIYNVYDFADLIRKEMGEDSYKYFIDTMDDYETSMKYLEEEINEYRSMER